MVWDGMSCQTSGPRIIPFARQPTRYKNENCHHLCVRAGAGAGHVWPEPGPGPYGRFANQHYYPNRTRNSTHVHVMDQHVQVAAGRVGGSGEVVPWGAEGILTNQYDERTEPDRSKSRRWCDEGETPFSNPR